MKFLGGRKTVDAGQGLAQFLPFVAEDIPACMMAADLDMNLVFLNRMARETLEKLDPEIRRTFRVGTNELLGGSIHRVHSDPDRVRRILRDPKSFPHHVTLRFGNVALRSVINAVHDRSGETVGYVVVWESVADREREAQAVTDDLWSIASSATASARLIASSSTDSTTQADLVAAAAEEMSTTIGELSSQMHLAASATDRSVSAANEVGASMTALTQSMAEIAGLVGFIEGVADQTNLLALNATIEAARAGDAGKGFAVVASEVKSLAQQVASATGEIRSKVQSMKESSTEADTSIRDMTNMVGEINSLQSNIATAIQEQTLTAHEITRSIAMVAENSHGLTDVAESLSDIAGQVEKRAGDLKGLLFES